MTGGVAVELNAVRRVFPGNRVVIHSMSLQVAAGEFLAVLGPSGCGKSTLLRMLARLDQPDGGFISFPLADSFQTAFVFQDAHLLPWRNALENAALPLELMGISKSERRERARAALSRVNLAEACDLFPAQLSGGMRMRVSLARALTTEPRLFLLDEPFAALDEITRFQLEVMSSFSRVFRRRRGIASTMEVSSAWTVADGGDESTKDISPITSPDMRRATCFPSFLCPRRRGVAGEREIEPDIVVHRAKVDNSGGLWHHSGRNTIREVAGSSPRR
jgi:ABC-type nitrate/sulfonate/bicarbonate transport system ATPase subunit